MQLFLLEPMHKLEVLSGALTPCANLNYVYLGYTYSQYKNVTFLREWLKMRNRKWGNGEMKKWKHVYRQDWQTGSLACETMVYLTQRTINWQGEEVHEIMGARCGWELHSRSPVQSPLSQRRECGKW